MVARVVPQSARRRHAESRKPDLRGVVAGGRWPVLGARHPRGPRREAPTVRLAVGFACSARFLAKIAPKHLIWVG
mgnify:CR=1 FL=1